MDCGDLHRHVGLELWPLDRRPLPRKVCRSSAGWTRISRDFTTVELNASYYRWPSDAAFASWRRRLPSNFLLTVKAPGALTHVKRLYSPEQWLQRIKGGLSRLGPNRGVLLVQLPPSAVIDEPRLAYFLGRLPPALKVAVEFRNASWNTESIFELLERHGAAYCVMSGARLPCILRATAPFVYVQAARPRRPVALCRLVLGRRPAMVERSDS